MANFLAAILFAWSRRILFWKFYTWMLFWKSSRFCFGRSIDGFLVRKWYDSIPSAPKIFHYNVVQCHTKKVVGFCLCVLTVWCIVCKAVWFCLRQSDDVFISSKVVWFLAVTFVDVFIKWKIVRFCFGWLVDLFVMQKVVRCCFGVWWHIHSPKSSWILF